MSTEHIAGKDACPGCGDLIPDRYKDKGVCGNCYGTTDDPWHQPAGPEAPMPDAEGGAAYPAHWVRKPWPDFRFPSVDEWIEWFLTAPRDQQQAEVAMSLKDTERAMRCLMLHPRGGVLPPARTDA